MTREIHLEADCRRLGCEEFASRTFDQLHETYRYPASVMTVPVNVEAHLARHRTFRKRTDRARRLGYRFWEIQRLDFEEDVFEVNTSATERQGRPMSQGYLTRPVFVDKRKACDRHHVYTYGVLQGEKLRAYLWLYRVGELAMVSSILGHARYLRDDIMYLLVAGVLYEQAALGGTFFYNMHDSGTDGLRFFKERLGLKPERVEWVLG